MSSINYRRIPHIAKEIEELVTLSVDLRWSWSHKTDAFWERLHPELWWRTRNPFLVLQTVSGAKLQEIAQDPLMKSLARLLIDDYKRQRSREGWFKQNHPDSDMQVAYFSMEYGLSDALRIYSGGLGILAGDHLKTCSDLSVPLCGIGLLYQRGYYRQSLDSYGNQLEFYPYNDPSQLPVTALRDKEGEWLRVSVEFPGRTIVLKTWEVTVGNVRLFLLDSNDPLNNPADRGITSELYGGGTEMRIQQELLLGVGGWRLLNALGITPTVCHLNEGHAAMVVLERARHYMEKDSISFEEALHLCRPGTVFTTHTPVEAGFDRFDHHLAYRYLEPLAEKIGVGVETLLALGREHEDNTNEPLNMAYLAIRGAGAVNGVSKLHGAVSRQIFNPIFKELPEKSVPITHVTNGIHVPSWDASEATDFWREICGDDIWFGEFETLEEKIMEVEDSALWELRTKLRSKLVDFVRKRLRLQLESTGFLRDRFDPDQNGILDKDTLTIGFARRFATYKRPNLLLYDIPRFLKILNNAERPIQLILAGKAHPADQAGKDMIRQWCEFIAKYNLHNKVIYLADYDMALGEHLVHGVDLWLNNPRKPMEASGTSGMKVLVNGGLNLSIPDGWWAEGYAEDVGWSIESETKHSDQSAQDKEDSETLFRLLEEEVIPAFYERDEETSLPTAWLHRMRNSMARLTSEFSTNRMIREYVNNLYLPAHEKFKTRTEGLSSEFGEFMSWRKAVTENWNSVSCGQGKLVEKKGKTVLYLPVFAEHLNAHSLVVKLKVNGDAEHEIIYELEQGDELAWQEGGCEFILELEDKKVLKDATILICPAHPLAILPLEMPLMKALPLKLHSDK
jgi:starch phosphorylase